MSAGNDSILGAFLYETNSLLEQLDSIVLSAEQQEDFSEDDVNSIFRIMHTIKGASAMMEFTAMMKIAHRAEDLFSIVRDKSISIVPQERRPELFDLLFACIDFFRLEAENIQNEQPLTENIDSLLGKVNSLIGQIQGAPQEQESAMTNGSSADMSSVATNSAYPFGLQVFFDEGVGMENLRASMLVTSIAEFCASDDFIFTPENVASDPTTAEQIITSGFLLSFKNKTDRDTAVVSVTSAGSVRTYQPIDSAPEPETQAAVDTASDTPATKRPTANKTAAKSEVSQLSKESLISVNLSKLDHLAAVVGEIVITESMVTGSPDLKDQSLPNFSKSARQLRKLTDELQDVSMSLRMIPVSATFQKMHRIVRDMAKKLGKQATLTLIGEETEVDKTIVDSIGDPLMHIVRNSMDHGLESGPDERVAVGKDPTGSITLSARHTGGEVIIEISDDGQGVNYDAVLSKAIRNGLAQPDLEYSHREILGFLLAPGFSTNASVTEFSGRGVGMDVVKQNIESVGGTISISSTPGQGMTTTLKIPLTMAIMSGMEVAVGSSVFTVPIRNIRQSFKITEEDIVQDAYGGELFRSMGQYYPVLRLRNVLGISDGISDVSQGILMWLDSDEQSYCLFVDELLGEQQVVVKPLPPYFNSFGIKDKGIVGCTILGDGSISVILNVETLYSGAS